MAEERLSIRVDESGAEEASRNVEGIGEAAEGAEEKSQLLGKALVALGGALTINALSDLSDRFLQMESRLALVTDGANELNTALDEMHRISRETFTSVEQTSERFVMLSRSLRDTSLAQDEVIGLTETMNQAFAVAAVDGDAALAALSQGFEEGRVRAGALAQVLRDVPPIAEALERHFNATGQELIEMGRSGEISAEEFARAVQSASGDIQREFDENVVPSISDGMQAIQDSLLMFVGELSNATGLGENAAEALLKLADNLEKILAAVAIPAAIIALRKLTAVMLANPWTALATGIGVLAVSLMDFGDDVDVTVAKFSSMNDELERNIERWNNLPGTVERAEQAQQNIRREIELTERQFRAARGALDDMEDGFKDAIAAGELTFKEFREAQSDVAELEERLEGLHRELERSVGIYGDAEEALRAKTEALELYARTLEPAVEGIRGMLSGLSRFPEMMRGVGVEIEDAGDKAEDAAGKVRAFRDSFQESPITAQDLIDDDFEQEINAELDRALGGFLSAEERVHSLRRAIGELSEGTDTSALGAGDPLAGVQVDEAHEAFREQAEQTASFTQMAMVNAMGEFERAGMRAFDSIADGAFNLRETVSDLASDISRMLFQMGMQAGTASLGGSLGLPGFATGGSFTVGGSGGTDSQFVPIMATPGERVTVETPQQQRQSDQGRSGGDMTLSTNFDGQGVAEAMTTFIQSPAGRRAISQTITMNPKMFRRLFR